MVDGRDACQVRQGGLESDSEDDETLPLVRGALAPMLVVSEQGECLREYMNKCISAICAPACGSNLQVLCFQ